MTDTGSQPDAEAEQLIQELLDAGFAYEANTGPVDAEEETPEEETPEETPDEEETGEPTEPTEPVFEEPDAGRGAHSGRLELKGTPLTELEADNLLRLRQILIEHPELASEMESRLAGRPAPAPETAGETGPPEPPKLPDYIDPDDEQSVRLWNEIQEVRSRQTETDSAVTSAVEAAGQAKVQADIANALDRFKADHPDLTDEEIASIRNYTSANVNIPGVMSNYPLDPVTGLVKSLEIGSLSDPGVRDKVLGIKHDDRGEQDRARQKDLTKLSGSTGSASRRPPKEKKPSSWNDVANRLAKELESLGGTNP